MVVIRKEEKKYTFNYTLAEHQEKHGLLSDKTEKFRLNFFRIFIDFFCFCDTQLNRKCMF
jgi:hypothetical protein